MIKFWASMIALEVSAHRRNPCWLMGLSGSANPRFCGRSTGWNPFVRGAVAGQ